MKIFLDDERDPPKHRMKEYIIARSFQDFKDLVDDVALQGESIEFISFDHDLGLGKDGMECAKYLVAVDMKSNILRQDFYFFSHSQNPIGARNIENFLWNYCEMKGIA